MQESITEKTAKPTGRALQRFGAAGSVSDLEEEIRHLGGRPLVTTRTKDAPDTVVAELPAGAVVSTGILLAQPTAPAPVELMSWDANPECAPHCSGPLQRLHAPVLYAQQGLDASDAAWGASVVGMRTKTVCPCAQVVVKLQRGDVGPTCVKFPACGMDQLVRTIREAHNPEAPAVFRYCECRGRDAAAVSPTVQRLSSPGRCEAPAVGPTEAAMLALDACIELDATMGETEEEEDGEIGGARLGSAVLYDLASDWMEHLGWTKLAAAVPQFVEFAQINRTALSRLECACFSLHSMLAGEIPESPAFSACLAGVRSGMSSITKKRARKGRRAEYEYWELGTKEAREELARANLYGSAHAVAEFERRRGAGAARCIAMLTTAADDLVKHLASADGIPKGEYCLALPPGRVLFVSTGPVVEQFLASAPVLILAAERGATSRCPMDSIVSGFVDPDVPLLDIIQSAEAAKRLIARDISARSSAGRGKRAAPDNDDGAGCSSSEPIAAWSPAMAANFYRSLPTLLDSLFDRNVMTAIAMLGAVWSMPDEAYCRSKDEPEGPPAGIYLTPVWTPTRGGMSAMIEFDGEEEGTHLVCRGTLLAGILAYLLPDRLHRLDWRLAEHLETEVDRLCARYDGDGAAAAELPARDDEEFAERIRELPYGDLKLGIMRRRQAGGGGPHVMRTAEELEQFYAFCGDANAPVDIRRAMFCCVTVLANEDAGVYCARFPLPLRRPWSHQLCCEHCPRGAAAATPTPAADETLEAALAGADETAVFRAIVEALVVSGCQPMSSKPPEDASGGGVGALLENRGRYSYSMLYGLSIPAVRPPRAPVATAGEHRLQFEHTATPQVPYLCTCERVLAFFAPDPVRGALMGYPCVSLSTPEIRQTCTDDTEETMPVGRLCPPGGLDRPNPASGSRICGRFGTTALKSDACSWCLFKFVVEEKETAGRYGLSQPGPAIVGPCRRCTAAGIIHRYHRDCARALGIIETGCTLACPACLTPYDWRGSEVPATEHAFEVGCPVTSDGGHRFASTANSISAKFPEVDPAAEPAILVSCSVCNLRRPVFAWTFIPTKHGVVRLDFDCRECADAFDMSIDAQVGWAASPSAYPLYTVVPKQWRRPFLGFAAEEVGDTSPHLAASCSTAPAIQADT